MEPVYRKDPSAREFHEGVVVLPIDPQNPPRNPYVTHEDVREDGHPYKCTCYVNVHSSTGDGHIIVNRNCIHHGHLLDWVEEERKKCS